MVLILYFSGTGNTRWVAEELGKELNQRGMECAPAISIESIDVKEANHLLAKSDAVLFGYPIYGSYTCELMVKFLQQMEIPARTKVGFFCTQWMFSGDGARVGYEIISKVEKGFPEGAKRSQIVVKWGMHFNMPNNLNCGGFGWIPITNDPVKIGRVLSRNKRKIKKYADKIVGGRTYRKGYSRLAWLLGLVQRPGYLKIYTRFQSAFKIDQGKCTRCGKCFKVCPAENIMKEPEGYVIHDKCAACMRCYNFCPAKAITFFGKPHMEGKDTYKGPIVNKI